MAIRGKVVFEYRCSVCNMDYHDWSEETARTLAVNCEENKPKFAHTFKKGDILSYTFFEQDDELIREVEVLATFFEKKSHEPMYIVKATKKSGLLAQSDNQISLHADRLKKVILAKTVAGQIKV